MTSDRFSPNSRFLGRARLRPQYRRHAPALDPARWYNLIPPPDDARTPPFYHFVWIDVGGQPLALPTRWLEIDLEEGSTRGPS